MFHEILQNAFALANRRIGVVFLEILWKAAWFFLTVGMLAVAFSWFTSQLQSIEWQDTGIPAINGLLATTLLREFWNANRDQFVTLILLVVSASALLWIMLEALFRSKYVVAPVGAGFSRPAPAEAGAYGGTYLFALGSAVKLVMLGSAALILGVISLGPYLTTPLAEWSQLWPDTRGAIFVSFIALLAFAFLLSIFETVFRSDAIDLLGKDLFRVGAVIGILMVIEAMIGVTTAIVLLAVFLNVGQVIEALVVLAAAGLAIVVLNLIHSYLLLVRFSAISIMRRNVIEI